MVRDAERAEKGVDSYGIDEQKSSTPSGIVAMIHKKWALPAVHPKILIQKTRKNCWTLAGRVWAAKIKIETCGEVEAK